MPQSQTCPDTGGRWEVPCLPLFPGGDDWQPAGLGRGEAVLTPVRSCSELPRGAGSSWIRAETAGSAWGSGSGSFTSQVALSHDLLFLPVHAGELPSPQLFLFQRDSQLFLASWLVGESDCGTGVPAAWETPMDIPFAVRTILPSRCHPCPRVLSCCKTAGAPHYL